MAACSERVAFAWAPEELSGFQWLGGLRGSGCCGLVFRVDGFWDISCFGIYVWLFV